MKNRYFLSLLGVAFVGIGSLTFGQVLPMLKETETNVRLSATAIMSHGTLCKSAIAQETDVAFKDVAKKSICAPLREVKNLKIDRTFAIPTKKAQFNYKVVISPQSKLTAKSVVVEDLVPAGMTINKTYTEAKGVVINIKQKKASIASVSFIKPVIIYMSVSLPEVACQGFSPKLQKTSTKFGICPIQQVPGATTGDVRAYCLPRHHALENGNCTWQSNDCVWHTSSVSHASAVDSCATSPGEVDVGCVISACGGVACTNGPQIAGQTNLPACAGTTTTKPTTATPTR
jgi:hypothetical protein